ncbi:MAG: hypothetical protein JWM73_865 [Solirubrobacterales bacterium]|nr:hypothetical protein [Solirubrobacterales bacterium]
MPAYRAQATIRESVESALAQTVADLEVIVVDDGSPEPMADVLAGLDDPRLRILRHARNRRAPAARNTALAAARAPLVSQLDADDLWEPDYLERVLPRFEDPAVGLVYANATILGHPTGHDTYIVDPSVHPMDRFPKLAEQNPIPALTATMRADAVRGVGGYAEWLWVCDDYHLYMKLARAGWRFGYVDEKLARYRWPTAERGQSFDRTAAERDELKMYAGFALRHPLTPGPRHQVRARVRRARGRRGHTSPVKHLQSQLAGLPRRAWLTLRHLGLREFWRRITAFPRRLRPLPADPHSDPMLFESLRAAEWYRTHGTPVCIVIPTYGDPALVGEAVRSVQATTDPAKVRIVVADDGSDERHLRKLRRLEGIELVEGGAQRGFAANCNRGIERLRDGEDLVLLNSDTVAHERWLDGLQFTAHHASLGIAGPKLLYADGTIQSAGSVRNAGAPEWFDHRYRFKPADHPAANVVGVCLAVTGAAMYVRRDCLEAIGGRLDEEYGMAFEDVDWCLRAWEAGFRVGYAPFSTLTHLESKTRGTEQGERELASQRLFWERWGAWLDDRDVTGPGGGLRIVYVTEGTGVGGGHRVVFQHLVGLRDAGHDVELWSLGERPDWFDLGEIPVRTFASYRELELALEPVPAIKVATWWNTAEFVWPAAVRHGIPAYFVQDIETSYYDHEPLMHGRVLDSYRLEFRAVTTSSWNADRLREMHIGPAVVAPGLDDRFGPRAGVARRDDVVLALGRSDPLKNFALTRAAWDGLGAPRPELWLFGIEPELADAEGIRYVERPSDEGVNELLNQATVFVQTSRHEGFCLPILEAMAAGLPVVCTDADGNRDFCEDGVNCLMPAAEPEAVAAAIRRVLGDPALRGRLAAAGRETAARYRWADRVPELARFYESIAGARTEA